MPSTSGDFSFFACVCQKIVVPLQPKRLETRKKMKKVFLFLLPIWAFGLVSCNTISQRNDSIIFSEVPVIPDTIIDPIDPEITPELPTIANPGAGYTTIAIYAEVCPRGAYLVGTTNAWYPDDDTYSFEPVASAPNWYALTVPYTSDFQGKVVARPSEEDVPLSWTYQWGKNYDPNSWAECDRNDMALDDNVIILAGNGEFEYENCGQPKLVHVANDGVVYIWIKNWEVSPIIEPCPLEICWAKSDWDSPYAHYVYGIWYWKQMNAVNDSVFELYTRWGGNGLSINDINEDHGHAWYPLDHETVTLIDNPQAGDSVLVTFVSRKQTTGRLSIRMLEKAQSTTPSTATGKVATRR